MKYCLHNETQCPHGQLIHTSHNSMIQCNGIDIPILSAHNTKDGIPRATAPKWCPLRNEPVRESIRRIIEDPSVAARWGPSRKSHKRLFSDAQVIDIRKRFKKGESQNHIAKIYGVSQGIISGICTGRNYKDVV